MAVIQVVVQTPPPEMPQIPVDPNLIVHQIVPLVGGLAAMIIGALILRAMFRSPIGEAIAEGIRLRRRRRYGLSDEGGDEHRVQALEEQIRRLTSQVSELGERLDFTERVLVEHRERRIGTGK